MLTLLKQDKLFVLPFILAIAIILWGEQLFSLQNIALYYDTSSMPLYAILKKILQPDSVYSVLISILITLLNVYLIVRLNANYRLINKGTYLPGVLYMFFAMSHETLRQLNPLLFGVTFLLLSIDRILISYKEHVAIRHYFEASFLLSIGSLFYFNLIYFEIFILISLIVLRTFNWREWISSVIGCITPYIFVFGYYFLTDSLIELLQVISYNFTFFAGYSFLNLFHILFYSFTLFLFLIAFFITFSGYIKKVSVLKGYWLLFILFVSSIGLFFLVPATSIELISIIGIPLSFYLSNYLVNINSTALGEVIFTTFLGLYITLLILS